MVNEPTVVELRDECRMIDTVTRCLERALDDLHPAGRPYRSTLGVEMPNQGDYSDDELGRAMFARDLLARRNDWLQRRYVEHSNRSAQREETSAARGRGIERFLDGSLTLDALTRVTAATPHAMQELREERRAQQRDAREQRIDDLSRDTRAGAA
jgi:hypothetical protein